ncbi:ABC transporter permease [Acidobacteriota bacterium]
MIKDRRNLKIHEFFLKQVISFDNHENLSGDFEEMFDRISHERGSFKAYLWYTFQILKLVPSYFRNYIYWSLTMLKNYLKIALRNIKKSKTYSFINILGLAIGMACCILIFFYVQDELSYDRYHEKADRIYRVVDSGEAPGRMSFDLALTSAPFAPTLKADFPEVKDSVRLYRRKRLVANGERKYYEYNLFYADKSLFNIFTLPLVKGNPETALQSPQTIVLSESTALKYFGNNEVLNQNLSLDGQDFLVTGIMKDMPENSHFIADLFVSFKTLEQIPVFQERYIQDWVRHEFYTYVLLEDGHSREVLEAKLPAFIEKYAAHQVKEVLGGTLSSSLQPLKNIHLHSHRQVEIRPNGDIKYIYIFSFIALIILLIACVNFMNLATARSAKRAMEVGLRKVVGASRTQLVRQFLGESLMFTYFALLFALVIVFASLPSFNTLTGKEINISYLNNPILLGGLLLILIFVGLTSGSYPAFFISKYQPANALKGGKSTPSKRSFLRRGLVLLQFSISIILIICTSVVLDQLDFLRNKKLGFNKDHVVVVPITANSFRQNLESVKDSFMQNPNITHASVAHSVPGGMAAGDAIRMVKEEGTQTMTVRMVYTDHDYIKTMGLEIVEGRDFSKDMSTDASEAFLINEAAVRAWQLENPLETRLEWGGPEYGVEKKGKVIGVLKDYQFQSLKDEINPLVIQIEPQDTTVFTFRVRPEGIPETLRFIETKWKELDPAHPFEYYFMDESFDRLYRSEEKLSQIFGIFSSLAIFIAALGLFGLALFMVEQRTKEIGVRKILGATLGNIFVLVSKEFVYLVLVANVIAWPIAYFLMRNWLQNFSYRIDMGLGIFILAGFIALAIALLTISFQAIKAAVADPIKSLRYE